MEYKNPVTKENIEKDRITLLRSQAWSKCIQWTALVLSLAPIGVIAWMVRSGTVDTESVGFWSITIGLMIVTFTLVLFGSFLSIHAPLFTRAINSNDVHFDVYNAVENALRSELGDYLPGLKNRHYRLSLGEELVRELTHMREREVAITDGLKKEMRNTEFESGIKKLIRECLRHEEEIPNFEKLFNEATQDAASSNVVKMKDT